MGCVLAVFVVATTMKLVADRFLVTPDGRARDLASGADVALVVSPVGGASDQARWTARCDWFTSVRHRSLAELVDYGMTGETRRFEAWVSGPPWRGQAEVACRAVQAATGFLAACGRAPGGTDVGNVRTLGGRPVMLPAPDAGFETEGGRPPAGDSSPAHDSLETCGMSLVARRGTRALAEAIAQPGGAGPRALGVWGDEGAGVTTIVRELARVARAQGFVPVSAAWKDVNVVRLLASLLKDRSLLVIGSRVAGRAWLDLVQWTLRSPRPHVLLCTSAVDAARVESVYLAPLPPDLLVGAVIPERTGRSGEVRQRIERAARRSGGLPGSFTELLWGRNEARYGSASPTRSLAAEQSAPYGGPAVEPALHDRPPWPVPGDVCAVRRRLDGAADRLRRGRHAAGERDLRAAVAALARRHDWADAAQGLLTLASSLLKRGHADSARCVLATAREYADRAGAGAVTLDAALLAGVAWCDLGKLDAAQVVLIAAQEAARAARDELRAASAGLALARCLFWCGRYEDAHRRAAEAGTPGGPATNGIKALMVQARAAVGMHDPAAAVGHAKRALEAAERLGDTGLVAEARCHTAFVHLSLGDGAAVARDTAMAIRAARAAHEPQVALRARLIAAEYHRRQGQLSAGRSLITRLARVMSTLPPIVRARCALLSDLLASNGLEAEVARRHVSLTGMEALALFVSIAPAGRGRDHQALEGVLEILQFCQGADDDRTALQHVCATLRATLQAVSVGLVVVERGSLVPLVWDGERPEAPMASRVVDARTTIAPHRWNDSIEGGAPVQYGGDMFGAIVARWTIASPPVFERAPTLMTLAATVASPMTAATLARRAIPPTAAADELLGVSPVMVEVRRSIERAASAPFGVLVEGESGSGKELAARALHRQGPRRDRPFCTLNCAALPDELVEAELFGHTKGAFTGASTERIGVFEEAHMGTLLLDEVGELSPRAQAKILRTLQQNEVRRVGENVSRRIDVRVVAATNRDLRQEVAAGRFRLDLLYRLDVIRISMPALRERREDIAILVHCLWQEATARVGSRATLSAATVAALARYDWPGNVRELQNVLAALAVRSPRRAAVPPTALPAVFQPAGERETWRLEEARRTFDERFVRAALVRTGGHRGRAAEELGISRQGLTKLMTRLGIDAQTGVA